MSPNLPARRSVAVARPPASVELADRWILALDASDKTRRDYRKAVASFLPLVDEKGAKLSREDVIAWRDALAAKCKPATVNTYLAAVRQFLKWTHSNAILPNVAADVKRIPGDSDESRGTVADDALLAILRAARSAPGIRGLRDFALLNLIMRTGLRCQEAAKALCGGLQEDGNRHVLYVQGKGRRSADRFVVLTEEAYRPIIDYFHERDMGVNAEAPLFAGRDDLTPLAPRTINHIYKQAAKAAGVPNTSPHWLRHTFAVKVLEAGADVVRVQRALRHSKIDTTLGYLRHSDRLKDAAEDKFSLKEKP
jgi:integrase/recombinase XerD